MNIFENSKPFTFDRVIRIIVSIIVFITIYIFINSTSVALVPFFIAWLLAYILNPIVDFVQINLRFKNRFLSIVTVLVLVLAIITGSIWAVIPSLREESRDLLIAINELFKGHELVDFIPIELQKRITENFTIKEILSTIQTDNINSISNTIFKVIGDIFKGSYSVITMLLTVFVTILYIVFILLDFTKISNGAIDLIPHKYKDNIILIFEDLKFYMSRYFRGQAVVAFTVGILFAIGFKIIGLPLAIPLGLFIGLLNMVPYLQIIGIIPMAILSLMHCIGTGDSFWSIFGLSILVMCIVQILQDSLFVPKIMGKAMGLNPAVILLSLSIWGTLLGMIGLIIALPMTTILLSYYKRFVIKNKN